MNAKLYSAHAEMVPWGMPRPRNNQHDRLAIVFLADQAKMAKQDIAKGLGLDVKAIDNITSGGAAPNAAGATLDRLMTIESLLLSVYTPATAGTWFNQPNTICRGKTPAHLLATGGPSALEVILRAAAARIGA